MSSLCSSAIVPKPTIIGPQLPKNFEEQFDVLAAIKPMQKLQRTHLIFWSQSPEYVAAVNKGLKIIENLSDNLDALDLKVKDLFLARALRLTEEIKKANEENKISDFTNGNLQLLQHKLKKQGASREYYELVSFFEGIAPIAFSRGGSRFGYFKSKSQDEVYNPTDANGILKYCEEKWLLVPLSDQPDQKSVVDTLRQIVSSMRNVQPQGVVHKLTHEELLFGQVLIGQLMTNYRTQMDQAPFVSHQVFDQLTQLHQIFVKYRQERSELSIDRRALQSAKNAYGILLNVLDDDRFQHFYSQSEKMQELENADSILMDFITFHNNPASMVCNSKLTLVKENREAGVNVYLSGMPEDKGRELVVFFYGNNTFWNTRTFKFSAMQCGRGTEFGRLNGLVHQQALSAAGKAQAALESTRKSMAKQIGKVDKIRLVGYGLDGCTAQLIGMHYKKVVDDKADVLVIGCGVPAYMDESAAADMGNHIANGAGFRCINYVMAEDANLKDNGFTGPLGIHYDNSAFVAVPVPKGRMFAGETLASDYRKSYMSMLEIAQKMHRGLREVYAAATDVEKKLDLMAPPMESITNSSSISLLTRDRGDE